MQTVLRTDEILSKLPHRYDNIIVDTVTCIQEDSVERAELTVSFSEAERGLFLRTDPLSGKRTVITPFLMEILALGAGACTQRDADQLLIYAGIAMFKKVHDLVVDDVAFGVVTKRRSKGFFIPCEAQLYTSDNRLICTSELTAALVPVAALAQNTNKKTMALPEKKERISVDKTRYGKTISMVAIDAIVQCTADSIVTWYTYPQDHPFVRGHFPGNPVMMGVMQWMLVEDALQAYVWETYVAGSVPESLSLDAVILRADGVIVAEIKGYRAVLTVTDTGVYANLLETKKIIFREPLRPGESVYAVLTEIASL